MLLLVALLSSLSNIIRLEAETATLDGPVVASQRKGFSGTRYVTNLVKPNARILWRINAKPGIYEARLGYETESPNGFTISVNGLKASGMLSATGEKFGVADVGKIELSSGENEVTVERGWGNYDVDYLELTPASGSVRLRKPPSKLSDPKAGREAKMVYSTLLAHYGGETASGQYETGLADTKENSYVEEQTGKTPAIDGGDLSQYSPVTVAHEIPKDLVSNWIDAAKRGQILTLTWHWIAPADLLDDPHHRDARGEIEDDAWNYGFYTRASTFDIAKVLSDPKGDKYKLILRDIDAIAIQLRRLQDAHVPILWRPLHEAEGGWFWWGAKGPEACKKLWLLMFDRLTRVDGIHNLIWVWNSPNPDWYPGDSTVDVMSVDRYPEDRRETLSADWEALLARFNARKPLALAEFPGAPDVEHMRKLGESWLYFVSWYGGVGPRTTPPSILQSTYSSNL